jgi:Ser/Thr protein kinase RdoA (MazF antagonist)
MHALDEAARTVLFHYPFAVAHVMPLGNRGGFSGARLWRIDSTARPLCLRAWPPGMDPKRLGVLHGLMTQAQGAGLTYVPAVRSTREGPTWIECAGRLWDLTTWLPGRADFRENPSTDRLEAACVALAQLHRVWRKTSEGPCPAIRRRLECARQWLDLVATGWRPIFSGSDLDPVEPWALRAWRLAQVRIHDLPERLISWMTRPLPLQPCVCDIWHDHVLFEAAVVTGLIDYGSVKLDHVAVDLARLLGSLVGDDAQLRAVGLQSYRQIHPLTAEEEDLVTLLDETGTLLGAVNWLMWLYRRDRAFEDRNAVAGRLAEIVLRVERW